MIVTNRYLWTRKNGKNVNTHRKIIEDSIGRTLLYNEVVHHIDGNKTNNNLENLKLMSRSEHSKLHKKPMRMVILTCSVCGKVYLYRNSLYMFRKRKGKTKFMCSKRCVGLNSKCFLPHKTKNNN